ncbi:MAG TPA: HNH endonuclease [Anaerolineae bacterium]|nr:HNH endonuclease [Anaerolineae bacterium]
MSTYLPAMLRQKLQDADDQRCAYCQTSVGNTGQPLTIDHVVPQAIGGEAVFENLCLACRRCNEFKGSATAAGDPLTGNKTALFHPRRDHWNEHFSWDSSGTRIVGLTAIGRATVLALAMNDEAIVSARRRWVSAGWHPPQR